MKMLVVDDVVEINLLQVVFDNYKDFIVQSTLSLYVAGFHRDL